MHIVNERDLGRAIRDRRRQLGINQADLATRAGVSRQWVIEVEKGKPRTEIGLVLRTLRVLGLSLVAVARGHDPDATAPASLRVDLDSLLDGDTHRSPCDAT